MKLFSQVFGDEGIHNTSNFPLLNLQSHNRSVHLPYCVYETAFSQVQLFLDKALVQITNHKRLFLTRAKSFVHSNN